MPAEEATARLLRRVVARYYGFQIFFALLFWVPIFYEYQRRIGLSDEEIFRIQSVYYLFFCLLEIPTGYLADRWGRLECMRAGGWTLVLSNALPVLVPTATGMLVHFVLLALARSFVSGASSAYVYAYLADAGDTETFKTIEGRARSYGLVAKVVCWATVGLLFRSHIALPYGATVIASIASVAFAHALPQPRRRDGREPRALDLWPAFAALGRSPMLTLVMVQGVSVFVLGRIVQVNLFQPILSEKGVPVSSHGLVMASMALFEALGSGFPERVRRFVSDLDAVFVLTLLTGAALSIVALTGWVGTTIALMGFALVTGLSFPIQRQLFNDTIPDPRYRATLMSMESILDRAASAWVASLLAAYVTGGRTGRFLHVAAAVTVALMLVVFVAMKRSPRAPMGSAGGAPRTGS
jgi:MFS family permease